MKKEIRKKAIELRLKGLSLREICKILHISKSTASVWLREIILGSVAKKILYKKGKNCLIEANKVKIKNREAQLCEIDTVSNEYISGLKNIDGYSKLLCSVLYWCEGGKSGNTVNFTNSDPLLVTTFMNLFRISFKTNESKFRAIIHIHDYHNDLTQKEFWAKITSIPVNYFFESYRKQKGGKNLRKDYQGCISIRYHDYRILHELKSVYSQLAKIYGRVV